MYALISVSDKTGVLDLARQLVQLNVKLLSTGGTAKLLAENGLLVQEVAELTGFPEMLDGRVKTLHPRVHAGLLARRDLPGHMASLAEHHIETIDMLVVNLYPFEQTVAKAGCTLDDAIENIDIGGPAMVRSAAKNWRDVAVLTESHQYQTIVDELKHSGKVSTLTKFNLAQAAFNKVAQYDAAISNYLSSIVCPKNAAGHDTTPIGCEAPHLMDFGDQFNACFSKIQDLRYGENSHQKAALYQDISPLPGALVTAKQLQGKELSFNNIADADAAWECVKSFNVSTDGAACVIVKHANPCGVAIGASALEAYDKAYKTDSTSAFGGIIAFNREVDGDCAKLLTRQFIEVLIAPAFSEQALEIFKAKSNVRILQITLPSGEAARNAMDIKRVGSGILLQSADVLDISEKNFQVVTELKPSPSQIADLLFAWKVVRYVKSNAIVFCKDGMTFGVGAGQMSRLDSARIASIKAEHAGLDLKTTVVASDAFFPFRDGLDVVVDAGASCIIQPGGSVRDDEVIAAANERGVSMVFTGVRHFRH